MTTMKATTAVKSRRWTSSGLSLTTPTCLWVRQAVSGEALRGRRRHPSRCCLRHRRMRGRGASRGSSSHPGRGISRTKRTRKITSSDGTTCSMSPLTSSVNHGTVTGSAAATFASEVNEPPLPTSALTMTRTKARTWATRRTTTLPSRKWTPTIFSCSGTHTETERERRGVRLSDTPRSRGCCSGTTIRRMMDTAGRQSRGVV
mmetsp:Transcript_21743/g.53690  ORF Transcript_21743/g.53690 Transcript_21743/m.53690 type:complete len:203 (-) Transcript_21743:1343-1951(-)